MLPTGYRQATSWVHYTTSCNTQSSAPEDGQNNCPKHVELTGIINKPLLLHLVGCLYYFYQWCTLKQISDNEIYLLIKYIKSALWRVAKRLSYMEEARCLKVNATHNLTNIQKRQWEYIQIFKKIPARSMSALFTCYSYNFLLQSKSSYTACLGCILAIIIQKAWDVNYNSSCADNIKIGLCLVWYCKVSTALKMK